MITTVTTTIRTTSTTLTTTTSPIVSTKKTTIMPVTRENTATSDWFQRPYFELTSTTSVKGRNDYEEDDYDDWSDYFATTKIPPALTINPLVFFSSEPKRKTFQQMNFFPTYLSTPLINYLITSPTPSVTEYTPVNHSEGKRSFINKSLILF